MIRVALLFVCAASMSCRDDAAAPAESRASSAKAAASPLLTLGWTVESDQSSARFGTRLASGDVNGDGFDDVVVGAIDYDDPELSEGRVVLYLGGPLGPESVEAWSITSDEASAYLGYSIQRAGDVDADGYDDIILSTLWEAYVYRGSASGLDATPAWTDEDVGIYAMVSPAGDVNADGYDDVLVGAGTYLNHGRVKLFLGSATGVEPDPVWTVEGTQVGGFFGYGLAAAGDVNGDGYDDVAVGAPSYDADQVDEGRVFVYLGSADGLGTTAAWTAESNQGPAGGNPSPDFSEAMAAGDVNGDGYDDLVIGAEWYQRPGGGEGRAFLYLGSAAGLGTLAWVSPNTASEGISDGVAVGDVDGDGIADVVLSGREAVEVYLGAATVPASTAAWSAAATQVGTFFGEDVSAGDVNGDGQVDVLMGEPYFDGAVIESGRAYAYLTGCGGPDTDGDGVHDDCDECPGFDDELYDLDGDGACSVAAGGPADCDDADPTRFPGALELCNGLDDGCVGALSPDELDADGDGFIACAECADSDETRFPGAPERCNGLDDSCIGSVLGNEVDADGDSSPACEDCDDGDPTSSPALTEVCGDTRDNDCDFQKDEDCTEPVEPTPEEPPAGCGCRTAADTRAGVGLALIALWSLRRTRRPSRSSRASPSPSRWT